METSSPHAPAPSAQPDADPANPDDPTAAAWARARAAYLSGESASVVAGKLGVCERTLHRRAQREGWRRRDHPRLPMDVPQCMLDWDTDDPDSPLNHFTAASAREIADLLIDPMPSVYIRHAFRRSAECAAMGRVVEAKHWVHLSMMLQRLADAFPRPYGGETTPDRMRAAYAVAMRAVWGENNWPSDLPWPSGDEADDVGDVCPVSDESD